MHTRMEAPDGNQAAGDHHAQAATAFVRRVTDSEIRTLDTLIQFGSTVRNEADGLESDVDFLAVIADDADKSAVEEELRDIAYDVMLEYGRVVEVHVLSRAAFDRRRTHPFIRRAVREGTVHV